MSHCRCPRLYRLGWPFLQTSVFSNNGFREPSRIVLYGYVVEKIQMLFFMLYSGVFLFCFSSRNNSQTHTSRNHRLAYKNHHLTTKFLKKGINSSSLPSQILPYLTYLMLKALTSVRAFYISIFYLLDITFLIIRSRSVLRIKKYTSGAILERFRRISFLPVLRLIPPFSITHLPLTSNISTFKLES